MRTTEEEQERENRKGENNGKFVKGGKEDILKVEGSMGSYSFIGFEKVLIANIVIYFNY